MTKTILPATWECPAQFRARLGEKAGRQRAMTADGHLLLVLHAPPKPGQDDREARLFWRDAQGQWKSNALGAGISALKAHLDEFAERDDALDDQLSNADKASDYFRILQSVTPLGRTARHLLEALQQAREAMPADRDLINLRDRAGEIDRSLELLHHDAKNALDFTVARESEEQTHRTYEMMVASHRLNVLVAMFFPIATISTIFGMNLPSGLEGVRGPLAFWTVVGGAFLAGVLLSTAITRRPEAHEAYEDRERQS